MDLVIKELENAIQEIQCRTDNKYKGPKGKNKRSSRASKFNGLEGEGGERQDAPEQLNLEEAGHSSQYL